MVSSVEEEALALKQKGNQAFKEHDWPKAVDFYTKAIELNDKDPSFYCNRAQVCSSRVDGMSDEQGGRSWPLM